jgi:large conductance mechanosensitive channel
MNAKAMAREFRDFFFKSNVFALATAVVIGNAVSKVVDSVVKDLFMPVIGMVAPQGEWRLLRIPLARGAALNIGSFLGTVVDFVIIATAVFLVTKALLRAQAPPPPPPAKTCPECLESVPVAARRCRACASALPAA